MSRTPIDAKLVSDDKGADLVVGTYDDGSFFLANSKRAPYAIRVQDAAAVADYIVETLARKAA